MHDIILGNRIIVECKNAQPKTDFYLRIWSWFRIL